MPSRTAALASALGNIATGYLQGGRVASQDTRDAQRFRTDQMLRNIQLSQISNQIEQQRRRQASIEDLAQEMYGPRPSQYAQYGEEISMSPEAVIPATQGNPAMMKFARAFPGEFAKSLSARAFPGPSKPVQLSKGAVLVDPNTGRPIASNVQPRELVPGRDVPYPQNVAEQRLKEAAARGGIIKGYQRDPQGRLVPIEGGPAARLSPEKAAKSQLIDSGLSAMNEARQMLFQGGDVEKGSIDRMLVANMAAGTPFSEGRRARQLILDAVEAKLRAESGAAVPAEEVKRISERFFPSPLDSDRSIRTKTKRLIAFLEGTRGRIEGIRQTAPRPAMRNRGSEAMDKVRKKFGLTR